MLRALCHGFLFMLLMISASAIEAGYPRCNCDIDGFFSAEAILQCQKVSDFLIAAAYFSIPLELLYFATCSDLFPFKWIVFQFGAFIVLCGLTHLLNVFTYEPHSFILMLSLTISKLFTALVSFATTITLLTLIPQLLRVKVRENFLRIKARELDREVGMMKRQEEASWHVRMLTQEIRKSLDRHTILYTTLVELSKTLGLQNCAIWMPDECNKMMNLTHELRQRRSMELYEQIPINDSDVVEVHGLKGVKILRPDSLLALVSNGGDPEPGSIASIRMPMLKVSNFKGGTPELVQASYAILVLVLPREDSRIWSHHELEIIEVIADQVAVALSHAAVLEESQLMREKLVEQNRTLMQEKKNALMASEARNSFQKVMSQGMRRPIHSILGLLSMMQREKISSEQLLIINTITKISGVVSTLITDAMEISNINGERLTLEMRSFHLHSMIKEAASVARCLCDCRGFGFGVQVDNAVPDRVVGDEKRIFHAILHVIDKLLSAYDEGFVSFQVHNCCSESQGNHDQEWIAWKSNFPGVSVKFEIGIKTAECSDSSLSVPRAWRLNAERYDMGLSFNMCKELVQMMHGDIWVVPNFQGYPKSIKLVLQFQQQPLSPVSELSGSLGQPHHTPSSSPNFKGLRVLLADDDDVNRAVTRKLLEKLGCKVTSVSSGAQCLGSLSASGTPYQLVILDLHMPLMNGFEVAMRIRKLRSRSWPAIVAVTASAEEQVWQRCLQAGMNGLIRKPVMLQAIGDELYRVLHNT